MSCLNPLLAIYDGESLKILNHQDLSAEEARLKYNDCLIELPCGKCLECKKSYAEEWALRCALEAKESIGNFFITLTYKHQVYTKNEAYTDLKHFLDEVRKDYPEMKFHDCIEKGELEDRIHCHVCLFHMEIPDGKMIGCKFKSKHLEEQWGKGLIDIKPFDAGMAQYTAGYTAGSTKKTLYVGHSNNLGANYILKNKYKILENKGTIFIGKKAYKMGRWGYKILEKWGSIDIKPLREEQGRNAAANREANLMKTGKTLDEYWKSRIENRLNHKIIRKGGDGQ